MAVGEQPTWRQPLHRFDPQDGPHDARRSWYYQVKPHDVFDLDNQLSPILADLEGENWYSHPASMVLSMLST